MRLVLGIGLMVLVVAGGAGYFWWRYYGPGATGGPKQSGLVDSSPGKVPPAEEVVPITSATVTTRAVKRTIRVVGNLLGQEEVLLAAKIEARIRKVARDVGDRVKPDELLAEMEDRDFKLAKDEADRAVGVDLAKLGLSELPGPGFQINQVPLVLRQKSFQDNSQAKLDRIRRLGQVATREEVQTAETDVEVALSNVRAALLEAQTLLAGVKQRQASQAICAQKISDSRIVAEQLSADRKAAITRADSGGVPATSLEWVVAQRLISEGELARVGTPLFKLVLDNPLKMQAALPERLASQVALGQGVELTVEAWPGVVFRGQVSRVNPTVDQASRTFPIEVTVNNSDRRLRPGMFARAEVVIRASESAVTVPEEALTTFAGVTRIFIENDGMARMLQVRPGARLEVAEAKGGRVSIWVEISPVSGSQVIPRPGDKVAISGLDRLADKTRVRPRAES